MAYVKPDPVPTWDQSVGIGFYWQDHDHDFKHLSVPPVMVNSYNLTDQEQREEFTRILYTRYGSDLLSPIASCSCGKYQEQIYIGQRCEECRTLCEVPVNRPLEATVWMSRPNDVAGLINPIFYMMFDDATKKQSFSVIQWLINPYYRPRKPPARTLDAFMDLEIPRGLNYFIRHFDEIFEKLCAIKLIKPVSRDVPNPLVLIVQKYRHLLFPSYAPVPNRHCLVVEESITGQASTDISMLGIIDACGALAEIEHAIIPLSVPQQESRVAKAMDALVEFYRKWIYTHLRPKSGWPRKHIYSTALGYSSRTIITSLTGRHHYQELHYPWCAAVALFEEHLSGLLAKRGYMPNKITDLLADAAVRFCPIVDECFDELYEGARCIPGTDIKGWPVVFQRPPALYRGSAQLLYITKLIKEPGVNATALSVMVLRGPN